MPLLREGQGLERRRQAAVRSRDRLEGKHILLVEDIIDSGNTLRRLLALLEDRNPRSLPSAPCSTSGWCRDPPPEVRFIGFKAPKAFLVGYGLDHAEDFRHLPFIAD